MSLKNPTIGTRARFWKDGSGEVVGVDYMFTMRRALNVISRLRVLVSCVESLSDCMEC